jgi:hypothetical protein
MSEKNKLGNCLFSIEVTGEEVDIKVEGSARDLSETIANAAIHSEEVNMVLKMAMMMLVQHEMSQDEDQSEDEAPLFTTGPLGQA